MKRKILFLAGLIMLLLTGCNPKPMFTRISWNMNNINTNAYAGYINLKPGYIVTSSEVDYVLDTVTLKIEKVVD